ncbi:MAG: pyridoxal-dependent decarboxylase, partial [Gemmatimonadota bacterium]|nr:pyridoxal-dependent decarboxylase [Gemmatimonadota bacterium]
MTPDEFRRHGYATVDWIASYLERVESFPVLSAVMPGALRAALPAAPPEDGEPYEAILADVERLILPGITHWQSPNFFAYFSANASPPAMLAELVSAGLGVQGMLWATSPACTELETHVLDWLADALGLPEAFTSRGTGGGVIQDTASSATLCALLAARDRATDGAATERGLAAGLTAYASTQAHSSVEKAVGIAGLGRAHLRLIEVDDTFAMRPAALDDALRADRAAGRTPCFVAATIGTTSSTAMDPLPAIVEICRRHGVWLHVDAALAGNAAICPEFRQFQDGVAGADSYCVNPHKWLLTNFDCDAFYVADRGALLRALSILPEYLRNQATEAGAVIDYRDWQVPLGRRFRALKLWFVMRSYGLAGLRQHIRHHVELARRFADWVRADARFEIVAPVALNLVCFRLRGDDAPNERLLAALTDSG